ncbi:nuclear transport factor 2 family protein [Sphingosinicella microcystinivorans]|uniref:SnoaL-like domain-containing protein n=1 Tax=Sphingosinicella microcystinivorans TaxID=335406 RepID=A0ABX9SZB3_SPHMI|nr:nuclear transport factor 2 family protein [Sphingosinicella microcystinivorans]RKS89158.1 hypothetical protein DFR51_2372 [Sphingosinicella microcystinivorans]
MSSDHQHGPLTGVGRRELLAITGIVALYAKPASACVILEGAEALEEIVKTFLYALNERQFERLAPLLSDDFRFFPDLNESPVDGNAYIAGLQGEPTPKRDGIKSRTIDVSDFQLVQFEFVEFEDIPPERQTSCGNDFNWQKRIAIYDVTVLPVDPPVITLQSLSSPKPSHAPTAKPETPLDRTRIKSIRHITLPLLDNR